MIQLPLDSNEVIYIVNASLTWAKDEIYIDQANDVTMYASYQRLIIEKELPTTSQLTLQSFIQIIDDIS